MGDERKKKIEVELGIGVMWTCICAWEEEEEEEKWRKKIHKYTKEGRKAYDMGKKATSVWYWKQNFTLECVVVYYLIGLSTTAVCCCRLSVVEKFHFRLLSAINRDLKKAHSYEFFMLAESKW